MKYDSERMKVMRSLYAEWVGLVQASYEERDPATRKTLIVLAFQRERAYRKMVGEGLDRFYGKVR